MTEIKMITVYPGIVRILMGIDIGAGRVNREEPQEERLLKMEHFLETDSYQHHHDLNIIGRKLSFQELGELTDGEENDMKAILKFCPPGTNEFLNRYFNFD